MGSTRVDHGEGVAERDKKGRGEADIARDIKQKGHVQKETGASGYSL